MNLSSALLASLILPFAAIADETEGITSHSIAGAWTEEAHPGCVRTIFAFEENDVWIDGVDGNPGCLKGSKIGEPWTVTGKVHGGTNSLTVDMTNRGGSETTKGTHAKVPGSILQVIEWADGVKWTKLITEATEDIKWTKTKPSEMIAKEGSLFDTPDYPMKSDL